MKKNMDKFLKDLKPSYAELEQRNRELKEEVERLKAYETWFNADYN